MALRRYVTCDFTIRQDLCNKRCAYCGLNVARVPPMAVEREYVGLRQRDGTLGHMERADDIFSRARDALLRMRAKCDFLLAKISGGEVTAIPGWLTFIETLLTEHKYVQLLTNGTCFQENVASVLSRFGNFTVQITLDGIDDASNRLRGVTGSELQRVKRVVELLVASGVRVELNCVLTQANLSGLRKYTQWAHCVTAGEPGRLCILPKPVHGPRAPRFFPRGEAKRRFLEEWQDLPKTVLPPAAYMRRLADMLRLGQRAWACYVPYFVVGLDDRGTIPACTGGGGDLGVNDSGEDMLQHVGLFTPASAATTCTACMVYYEVLNLVVEGQIAVSELDALPAFQPSVIKERIRQIAAVLAPQSGGQGGSDTTRD